MLFCLSTTDAAWSIINLSTTTSSSSLVLGRSADAADVVLEDPRLPKLLSRRHCCLQLLPDGSQIQIQDLGSLNGTFVEGPLGTDGHKQLRQLQPSTPTILKAGDTLMLGGTDTVLDLHRQAVANPFKFLVCPPACSPTADDNGAGRQQAGADQAAGEPQPDPCHQQQQLHHLCAHTWSRLPAASTGQGGPVQHCAGRPNSSTAHDQEVHQRSVLQASAIVNSPQQQGQQPAFEAAVQQQQQHAGITVVGVCEPPAKRHRGSSLPPAAKPCSWRLQQQTEPAKRPQPQPLPAERTAAAAAGAVRQPAAGHAAAEPLQAWSSQGAAALGDVPAATGLLAAAHAAAGNSAAAAVQDVVHRRSTPQRTAAAAAVRRAAAGGAGSSAAEPSAVLAAAAVAGAGAGAAAGAVAAEGAGAETAAGAQAGGIDTVDLTESAPADTATDLIRAGHAAEAGQPQPSNAAPAAAAAAAAAGVWPGATPPSAVRQRKRTRPPSSSSKEMRRVKASTLECSICRELLVATHTLGCGHLFCGPCLAQWLEMQAHPNCPTCRTAVQGVPLRVYAMDGLVADAVMSSGSEPQELAARLEAWEAIRADTTARWQELFSSSSRSRAGRKAAARPAAAAAAAATAAGGGGSRGAGGRERAGQQQAVEPVHLREGDRHLLSGLRQPAAAAAGSGEAPPAVAAAAAGTAARRRGVGSRRGGRNARQRQPTGGAAGRGRGAAGEQQQQQQQRSLRQAAIDAMFH